MSDIPASDHPIDVYNFVCKGRFMRIEEDHKELKETFRINPIEIEGTLQETLRNYVKAFLSKNPEGSIYVMADAGNFVKPKET